MCVCVYIFFLLSSHRDPAQSCSSPFPACRYHSIHRSLCHCTSLPTTTNSPQPPVSPVSPLIPSSPSLFTYTTHNPQHLTLNISKTQAALYTLTNLVTFVLLQIAGKTPTRTSSLIVIMLVRVPTLPWKPGIIGSSFPVLETTLKLIKMTKYPGKSFIVL